MSATDTEPTEEQPAPDDADDDAGDDRPALDDDEKATFDLGAVDEVAADVEAAVAEEEETDEDTDDSGTDEEATSGTESRSVRLDDVSLSWGDMYVEIVATLLVVVVEEYGDGATLDADDVVELAQSGLIDISAQVDQLIAEMGGTTSLAPEYAILVGTGLLVVAVLVQETDIAQDALGDLAGENPLGGA